MNVHSVRQTLDREVNVVYISVVAVQAVHAVEEYLAGFYRVFPPARFIERYLPGLPRPGFVVFNALLFLPLSGYAIYLLRQGHPSESGNLVPKGECDE
jgi:hypothetical protein